MTDRMAFYVKSLAEYDTIVAAIVFVTFGLMGLWYSWKHSPIKLLRRLSGTPFWTFMLIIYLAVLSILFYETRVAP